MKFFNFIFCIISFSIISQISYSQCITINSAVLTQIGPSTGGTCNFTFDTNVTINQNNMRTLTFNIGTATICFSSGGFTDVKTDGTCGGTGNVQNNGSTLNLSATFAMPCSNSTVYSTSATDNGGACTANGSGATGLTSPLTYPTGFPVKLENLVSNSNSKNISINWITTEEKNFNNFVIQRSFDAKSFENIGSVKSKGKGSYVHIDSNPKIGYNYYRLKMVDIDGTLEYSKIISSVFNPNIKATLYPNPSENNQIVIHENLDLERIKLTDIMGRNVAFNSYISENKTIISPIQYFKNSEIIITYYTKENTISTQKILIKWKTITNPMF